MRGMVLRMKRFNPRTPCGVRQALTDSWATDSWFQSTHSLRSATLIWALKIPNQSSSFQSTHSLRSATETIRGDQRRMDCFNPRTPCGVRLFVRQVRRHPARFNPRTPCGVRPGRPPGDGFIQPVSIHALLAECDWYHPDSGLFHMVSIHALLAECDQLPSPPSSTRPEFQSTHSLRSATVSACFFFLFLPVSIHALLAECDRLHDDYFVRPQSFNPRTPCGVRLRPTLYIATQQSKSYFAPTSLKRPSLHGCSF